jgi:hypothetical protein
MGEGYLFGIECDCTSLFITFFGVDGCPYLSGRLIVIYAALHELFSSATLLDSRMFGSPVPIWNDNGGIEF